MEVRMLRDWSYHKQGEVVEVWEPTARNWMLNGIAEEVRQPAPEVRDADPEPVVETAEAPESEDVERADRRPKRR